MQGHLLTSCQSCQSEDLESILFLGHIPLSNTMASIDEPCQATSHFPLELMRCKHCTLVQINYSVDPQLLFPDNYLYLSGTTKTLRDNFSHLAKEVSHLYRNNLKNREFGKEAPQNFDSERATIAGWQGASENRNSEAKPTPPKTDSSGCFGISTPGSFVVDIGANDGSLLLPFKQAGYQVLGVEPTKAVEKAVQHNLPMIKDYWSLKVSQTIRKTYGLAQIITATNVFAHVLPIHEFIDAVLHLLDTEGVFVVECHYIQDLLETLQYDAIYHDHLKYYSVGSLKRLVEPHGLEIIRVQKIKTHGGSIRVYMARKGIRPIDSSLEAYLSGEKGIEDGSLWASFRSRVIASKLALLSLLRPIKAKGERIYGIGAPSRAITLTHYVGLDDGILDAIVEVSSSHKLHKWMPGTKIPILDEACLIRDQPEYALLYSWHIAEELAANLTNKGYKGKYIIPLPSPTIISNTLC